MQRQFHLFCANALSGDEFPFDTDCIEWGSLEHGIIERKCYIKETQLETEDEES
jgi:hypothetical protein